MNSKKYQKLEAKIREVCPELRTETSCKYPTEIGECSLTRIVDLPILLNHVLKAMKLEKGLIGQNRICVAKDYKDNNPYLCIKQGSEWKLLWNLNEPTLKGQSDEVKELLVKILV